MIEAGEFRGVMANLGDAFNSEEIGQLMLMSELNAEGKFAIDDIVSYGATYK
jgi:Ca2+-binding EF-hand superfamily protein